MTTAKAKRTSDYWKTTEGDRAIITNTYWYNGEHHHEGHWEKNNEPFDLPAVFFVDEETIETKTTIADAMNAYFDLKRKP